jgi:hypothetical protein
MKEATKERGLERQKNCITKTVEYGYDVIHAVIYLEVKGKDAAAAHQR